MRKIAGALLRRARKNRSLARLLDRLFTSWYQIPVPPTHFYSPLPDINSLRRNYDRWHREGDFRGMNFSLDEQCAFVAKLEKYSAECAALRSVAHITEEGYGLGYGVVEAHFLHCILRHIKPARVIEVGSGVSTWFALNALKMNRAEDARSSMLDCIEPYPTQELRELARGEGVNLQVKEVQDIHIAFFHSLGQRDILFIDSSAVSKLD